MKMVSLKQPCNQIIKSLLCPQHTGALVQRTDGDTGVAVIVDVDFCNSNNKKQQGGK